jgi:hypothetical protein
MLAPGTYNSATTDLCNSAPVGSQAPIATGNLLLSRKVCCRLSRNRSGTDQEIAMTKTTHRPLGTGKSLAPARRHSDDFVIRSHRPIFMAR